MRRKNLIPSDNLSTAKKIELLLVEKKYVEAYSACREALEGNLDPLQALHCKVVMLLCQYEEHAISSDAMLARAQQLIPAIQDITSRQMSLPFMQDEFKNYLEDLTDIVDFLSTTIGKMDYLECCIIAAADRTLEDTFENYIQIMEMKRSSDGLYQLRYLELLYSKMLQYDAENASLPMLLEAIADVYKTKALDAKVDAVKEFFLKSALEKLQAAHLGNKMLNNPCDRLSSEILFVLKDLLAICEVTRDKDGFVNEAVNIIFSPQFERMPLHEMDGEARSIILDEMKEHYVWIQEYISDELADKLQDKLERVLMPPPFNCYVKKRTIAGMGSEDFSERPNKRQRLGEGLFTASSQERLSEIFLAPDIKAPKIIN